jgi:hypothetical protein
MSVFKEEDIQKYPVLFSFINAKKNLGKIINQDNVNVYYRMSLNVGEKQPRALAWTLIEICIFLELNDHIDFLLTEFDIREQLKREKFRAFRVPVFTNQLSSFNKLINYYDNDIQPILSRVNFAIFRYAVKTGSLPFVQRLIELIDDKHCQTMISSHQYKAFRLAVDNHFDDIVEYFLLFHYVFDFAVGIKKNKIIQTYLEQFITHYLSRIKIQKTKKAFDLQKPEAILCTSIIRYLTLLSFKSSAENKITSESIALLIDIPQVREEIKNEK